MEASYPNPWKCEQKVFDSVDIGDYIGFVYCITEISSGKKYIGKKIFKNKKAKPPLKGKKNRRISWVESDWKQYYGSSPRLLAQIKDVGESRFQREIIYLCNTKSEMSYIESKEIFTRDALIEDDYFNDWISCRIQRNTLASMRD